jgi:hypothetical protein
MHSYFKKFTTRFIALLISFPGSVFGETILGPVQPIPVAYFGMHCFYCGASLRWPGEMDTLLPSGLGSWRLWDAIGTVWSALEPTKGQWDFRYLDYYVNQGQKRGVDLMLTLGQTPQWASARPNEIAGGGLGAAAEPADINDWKNYLATLSKRYKGKIQYYEIWNEPALSEIEKTIGTTGKAGFYSGSASKLAELELAAAVTIHAIDPLAKIVTPSFAGHAQGMRRLEAYLKAGGGKNADVIGFHFYQVDKISPEALPGFVRQVREITTRYGLGNKPIWNTESGLIIQPNGKTVAPLEPGGKGSLSIVKTEDEAAGLVSRYLILGAAIDLGRFYWFAWDSGSMGLATFMGFGKGRTINSAGQAFTRTMQWLQGARIVQCDVSMDQLSICKLDRAGTPQWIAWSTGQKIPYSFPQSTEISRYVTLDGAILPWTGSIFLSPKPILVVGK